MRIAQSVQLTKDEKEILTIWARGRRIPARQMQRAKIVLLAAEGHQNKTIAAQLNISRRTVQLWRQRFLALRLPGLEKDASRSGAKPRYGQNLRQQDSATLEQPLSKKQLYCDLSTIAKVLDSSAHAIHIVDPLPSAIALSPQQREALDVIVEEQPSLPPSDWPARAILMWSNGVSQSTTARELDVGEETVKLLRHRWLSSVGRIAAAEERVTKEFTNFMSLICQTLSEEPPAETTFAAPAGIAKTRTANRENPTESNELRPATKALIEILHHKPKVYGINRSNWTQRSLAEAFEKLYGQRPSKSTVSRLLRQAGLSWKKSRKVLTSPDPNYREKVELLLRTLQSLKANEDLFFIDELGPLQVKRYGGRCYTPKGDTPTHPQNQRAKGSITLYGALSATTNQVTWFYGNTKDSAGMIDLVEILYNQHHDKARIYLSWDAASWHGSNELVEWADNFNTWNNANSSGPIIGFVPLPSSAQFLDVIEAVFSAMKKAVIHNSDYQSEEEMKTAISVHFCERNEFFKHNPKRAGKRIWQIDFFEDQNHIRSGNYREW
jgi:transposase